MAPIPARLVLVAVAVGATFGLGAFTFYYAEGFSYFSTDPAACRNCHIMNEQYDSWLKGPHHAVATCVECHLPHEFAAKYVAKAENGYHHSKGFTLQDFHEPIRIKSKNAAILEANCRRCHEDFVHGILHGSSQSDDDARCTHCHRSIGHGARG